MVFPLYIKKTDVFGTNNIPNINSEIAINIANKMGVRYSERIDNSSNTVITPEDILQYSYGILYSRKYRKMYSDLLALDFPRIPFTNDFSYFKTISNLGKKMIMVHTCNNEINCTFPVQGNNEIGKYHFQNRNIWINQKQYFTNVDEQLWNYYIGGYQPLQKWLKDRKEMILSDDDIQHYKYMITAIQRTIEIMNKIDRVIEL